MGTYEALHRLPKVQRNDELDEKNGTKILVTPEDIEAAQQQPAVKPLQVETIDDSAATTPSTSPKNNFVQEVTTPIPQKNPQKTNSHKQPAHDEQELE